MGPQGDGDGGVLVVIPSTLDGVRLPMATLSSTSAPQTRKVPYRQYFVEPNVEEDNALFQGSPRLLRRQTVATSTPAASRKERT